MAKDVTHPPHATSSLLSRIPSPTFHLTPLTATTPTARRRLTLTPAKQLDANTLVNIEREVEDRLAFLALLWTGASSASAISSSSLSSVSTSLQIQLVRGRTLEDMFAWVECGGECNAAEPSYFSSQHGSWMVERDQISTPFNGQA